MLQHAEAWGQEEAAATLASVDEYETAQLMSAPMVTTLAGQRFSVQIERVRSTGVENSYTLEGTVARSEDGNGFSIRSRVERVGGEEEEDYE